MRKATQQRAEALTLTLDDVASISFERAVGPQKKLRWTGAQAASVLVAAVEVASRLEGLVDMLQQLECKGKAILGVDAVGFLRRSLDDMVNELVPDKGHAGDGDDFKVQVLRRGRAAA